ncbi:uncharacterized protein LOC142355375 isoform X2 [Convolutriloba macropyga]|uniref:uncharacterized protein LOC142355375 isoform X2 n=1 Tax=Convolutriloba macropyga TaxID=536237 RepID=UPI003F526224
MSCIFWLMLFTLGMLDVTTFLPSAEHHHCPNNFDSVPNVTDKCLHISSNTFKFHNHAQMYCKDITSQCELVEIRDRVELTAVLSYLNGRSSWANYEKLTLSVSLAFHGDAKGESSLYTTTFFGSPDSLDHVPSEVWTSVKEDHPEEIACSRLTKDKLQAHLCAEENIPIYAVCTIKKISLIEYIRQL